MKILHVLKSEPDEKTRTLISIVSEGEEATEFNLYGDGVDYGNLLDLVFENERVISWW